MATTKKSTAKITLRTVLQHVQALHSEMLIKFAAVDKRFVSLEKKMDDGFSGVNGRIDRLERRLSTQIDNIDKRLDDVEIKELPKLKKAVAAR